MEATRTILANLRNNGFENSLADAIAIAEELEIPCVSLQSGNVELNEQFSMLEDFNIKFSFLYDFQQLKTCSNDDIMNFSTNQQVSLTDSTSNESDIDVTELASELRKICLVLQEDFKSPFDVLTFIAQNDLAEMYSNVSVALRTILTTPVSVATAERSISKLKLVKNVYSVWGCWLLNEKFASN